MEGEHVLVTGAAGFVGSHLVDRLLERGARVTGVDNFDPFYSPAEKRANLAAASALPDFELIEADCAQPGAVDAALGPARIDVIVHLAAKAGVRPSIQDPAGYVRTNVGGTQAILDLARTREIRRVIFGSSSSVYGDGLRVPFRESDAVARPISPYAATKRAGELLCHTHHHLYGGAVLVLRFFTVYGPRQRPDLAIRKFTQLLDEGRPIPMFGDGTTERDYTWIGDIMDGVTAAIERTARVADEYEIINLGECRTTSLRRLIQLIGEALGVEPRIEQLPEQPGDVRRTCADVTKARDLLDYVPTTTIEEGIARFVEWYARGDS